MALRFTWDPKKAAANVRLHGVTFPEASTAFGDPLSITVPDPDHSEDEERFILTGLSRSQQLLVVVHVERRGTEIRLISARRASRPERTAYEEGE